MNPRRKFLLIGTVGLVALAAGVNSNFLAITDAIAQQFFLPKEGRPAVYREDV